MVLLIAIALAFAVGSIVLSTWIGPKRTGAVKGSAYESGMVPIGDARRRFNVRFYIVAMIFLVFDVEIVFFYPWAARFTHEVMAATRTADLMFVSMLIFVAILLLAYLYAWGKGVFRWD